MKQAWALVLGLGIVNCAPGYIKSADLEARDQGPSACRKSCEDIGMRMTALVLVGNEQPGCVCQPVTVQAPAPGPAAAPPSPSAPAEEGAAASTTGYVVIAAADAARRQAEQDHRRRQEQTHQK